MKPIKYYFHNLFFNNSRRNLNSIKTKGIKESYDFFIKSFKSKKSLYFVRFGDGEFVTLMKKDHRNYIYSKGLETELEASFKIKDNDYLIACPINYPYDEFHASGIYKNFSWQQDMIDVMKKKEFSEDVIYENPCIFQCMAVFKPKVLKAFLDEEIRPLKKMFIGSTSKEIAEKLYGKIDFYVKIPVKHAYESIDLWWPDIEENAKKVDLIIPSAGSTSNVIALRLWNLGIKSKVIDFGSIVDAVEYKISRSWIRLQGHKVQKVLSTNDRDKLSFQKKFLFFRKDVKFYFRNQIM
ncbi:GT-D fold domain-containing glycosyltransferase [Cellulophaga lytica]|uniref:GT-D fold domain-containing glycosyltransferase n=1 Tax=Cellulophaga lytica TaxID=979 RepID=UPI0009F8793E|nr:GT-D fold domain-containing glycosyltransferase [Cellulophaga lytica]MDO6855241.1 GT-D fold domain-containing glycosyltransferase [Cellulophaga lytica]